MLHRQLRLGIKPLETNVTALVLSRCSHDNTYSTTRMQRFKRNIRYCARFSMLISEKPLVPLLLHFGLHAYDKALPQGPVHQSVDQVWSSRRGIWLNLSEGTGDLVYRSTIFQGLLVAFILSTNQNIVSVRGWMVNGRG